MRHGRGRNHENQGLYEFVHGKFSVIGLRFLLHSLVPTLRLGTALLRLRCLRVTPVILSKLRRRASAHALTAPSPSGRGEFYLNRDFATPSRSLTRRTTNTPSATTSGKIGGSSTAQSRYQDCTRVDLRLQFRLDLVELAFLFAAKLFELGFPLLFEILLHHADLNRHLLEIHVLLALQFGDLVLDGFLFRLFLLVVFLAELFAGVGRLLASRPWFLLRCGRACDGRAAACESR